MATWFDESRLDDETALERADGRLRPLAEAGARVRREVGDAAEATDEAVARMLEQQARPRAVIAAGPDSRLLRAVLEPWCPVPFVAWPGAGAARLGRQPRPGRGAGARRRRHRHRLRGRRGGTPRLPGRRRLPAGSMVADHAAGRWSHDPADLEPRPAGDRGGDARVPRPGHARPARRRRAGRHGAGRRRDRLLAAPRPGGQPRQDAGHRAGRHQPARLGRLGAGRPRRPPGRRVDPPRQRPHRARRRRRAPAPVHRGGPPAQRVRRPVRRRRAASCRPMLLVLDDGGEEPWSASSAAGSRPRPPPAAYASRR